MFWYILFHTISIKNVKCIYNFICRIMSLKKKWEINMPEVTQLAGCWAGILFLTAGIHYLSRSPHPSLRLPASYLHLWCLDQLCGGEGERGRRARMNSTFVSVSHVWHFLDLIYSSKTLRKVSVFALIYKWGKQGGDLQRYNTEHRLCVAKSSHSFYHTHLIL